MIFQKALENRMVKLITKHFLLNHDKDIIVIYLFINRTCLTFIISEKTEICMIYESRKCITFVHDKVKLFKRMSLNKNLSSPNYHFKNKCEFFYISLISNNRQ